MMAAPPLRGSGSLSPCLPAGSLPRSRIFSRDRPDRSAGHGGDVVVAIVQRHRQGRHGFPGIGPDFPEGELDADIQGQGQGEADAAYEEQDRPVTPRYNEEFDAPAPPRRAPSSCR